MHRGNGPSPAGLPPRRDFLEARRATQTERRRFLSTESPLLGGPLPAEAGAEDIPVATTTYDPDADVYRMRKPVREVGREPLRDLRSLVPEYDEGRQVDDWGRSERIYR